jgi:hypothetical protein
MEQPDSEQSIVVGSGGIQPKPKVPPKLRRKRIIIAVVAVLAVVAVGTTLYQIFHKPYRVPIACTQEQPDDYEVMSERDIYCKLKQETGLDIRDLMEGRITSRTFKSFSEAEISARALYGMAKYDEKGYGKSVTAFKIAESKAIGSETNYAFYERYALAALTSKDKDLYEELRIKQRQAIENDQTLSPAQKQEKLDELDGVKNILENADE